MSDKAVKLIEVIADERSLRECKECSLLSIENGKPTCMFTNENHEEDCQLLGLK